MHPAPIDSSRQYICEFSRESLLLFAALVHRLLAEDPDHKIAQRGLDALIKQTDFVSNDPAMHKINKLPSITQELITDLLDSHYHQSALFGMDDSNWTSGS